MLRSILAIVAGSFALALLVMISTPLLGYAFGVPLSATSRPSAVPPGYLYSNLAAALLSAVAGGVTVARIAPAARMAHAAALGGLILVLGLMFAATASDHPAPRWYFFVMPLLGVAGVLIGGRLGNPASRPAS